MGGFVRLVESPDIPEELRVLLMGLDVVRV
jgi:hypothetical protein